MPERPRSLFVTVGSTLFTDLTARVLSPAFYDAVVPLGVSTLVVQLGKAPPPDTTALQADGRYTAVEKRGDAEGSFAFSPVGTPDTILNVRWFRYTNDFEGDVRRADAVISHAGSGSILTVLRTPRPLLVVPNTSLMDNHQGQLAEALQADNYLMVSSVDDLLQAVPRFLSRLAPAEANDDDDRQGGFTSFPPVQQGAFARILDETAGYA